MKTYSAEFKASMIEKLLPPHNADVVELARETGIPKDTLYSWGTVHESVMIWRDICGAGRPTASKKSVAPNSTKSTPARCSALVPV